MKEYENLLMHDAASRAIVRAGGSAEDVAVCLWKRLDSLKDKFLNVSAIAPRKFRLPDGRIVRYNAPDDCVPFES